VESSAVGGLRHAPVANAEEPIAYREPFRSMSKIIMWSRVQDHHGIVVRREAIGCSAMSTGPSGDCETPFFPHDEATSLSTRTLQGVRACLNRAARSAMARDKVKRNVVEITEVPAGLPGRPSKALTAQQADDVITKTASDRMHPYIVVSLLNGARTEELRALRWEHVHLEGRSDVTPPVPPFFDMWRSVRAGGDTKTTKSRRTIALFGIHSSRCSQMRACRSKTCPGSSVTAAPA
jgi:hypothetical protein